jgi:hypothetical protein
MPDGIGSFSSVNLYIPKKRQDRELKLLPNLQNTSKLTKLWCPSGYDTICLWGLQRPYQQVWRGNDPRAESKGV